MTKWVRLLLAALTMTLSLQPSWAEQEQEKEKRMLCQSPDKKHSAYVSGENIVITDNQVKKSAELTLKDPLVAGTSSIEEFKWIDNKRLAMSCHINPSLCSYTVFDVNGRTLNSYLGYNFYWSHDNKILAHNGQMIHFSEWPHSEYIEFNDRTVYPLSGPAYGKAAKVVHTFSPPFVWCKDDSKLALIDNVSHGKREVANLVLISRAGKVKTFKLPGSLTSDNEIKLTWQNNSKISVQAGKSTQIFSAKL